MSRLSALPLQWFRSMARSSSPGANGMACIAARQIYILPTGFGLLYGVMLIAMLFGANNYGSNPGFLLTFLLAGLGMAALFQTWKNLLGLEAGIRPGEPAFAGGNADFIAAILNPHTQARPGIVVYADSNPGGGGSGDIPACDNLQIGFCRAAPDRGWMPAGRVVVETRFPLGLFRAWCYLATDTATLIYPAAAETGDGLCRMGEASRNSTRRQPGDDDFSGHRPYQEGESVMHVDWKALARGKGWHVKQFDTAGGEELWLLWSEVRVTGTESRLSALARSVLDLYRIGATWGLDIPGIRIPPGSGTGHRDRCLQALALFDAEGGSGGATT